MNQAFRLQVPQLAPRMPGCWPDLLEGGGEAEPVLNWPAWKGARLQETGASAHSPGSQRALGHSGALVRARAAESKRRRLCHCCEP